MKEGKAHETGHCSQCGKASPCLEHGSGQGTEFVQRETRHGFPVVTEEEYHDIFRRDREDGDLIPQSSTGDFRGFVRNSKGELFFVDVVSTYVVRGSDIGGEGIRITTEGVPDYKKPGRRLGDKMESVLDVDEYDVLVSIPPEIQRADRIVVHSNFSEGEKSFLATNENDAALLRSYQDQGAEVVYPLSIDPQTDPDAHDMARRVHQEIVRHVEGGGRLDQLPDFVGEQVKQLKDYIRSNKE
ncbi:MAG: hypothetical protein COV59_03975 [Candidatus Magasanikbacteria bacterium CG11_big_fil_rev_8_21_14_0_20_39_34]|uniref:Uncharacterized protein n=1 Tax=Candidatus Magasanikbacteria bacterium CG11_big_fil_rev_8_21_14_0_20_39_34 TaxID=1974653 RepID=A0A2H0N4I0_9BACT|nr:MAG: hypothetical protein COV59_03975 [Candidatus Magasanikbacteria bacterium CG11_big_fil_rev_8_21_14_0_20_39_34]